ncbi:MAG: sulfite exporter TauE/SafE family protein [Pseudomonadota bacterium]
MLTEPAFYLVSVPAVLIYGIAKGGFGGAMAVLAVPLMAIAMSPTQAAAILLPILVLMDALVVRAYWGAFDRTSLKLLLPPALLGVALGYALADSLNDDFMRILIGTIALLFGLYGLLGRATRQVLPHHRGKASLWGAMAGFTSFSIHAGGTPFTIYVMPRGLSPVQFAGTSGLFFAVVNAVKLLPYHLLGQFSADNLLYSLVLAPLAPAGVWIGRFLVKRSDPRLYYGVISFFLMTVGGLLLWEGLGVWLQ